MDITVFNVGFGQSILMERACKIVCVNRLLRKSNLSPIIG